MLDPDAKSAELFAAEDAPQKKDLGRNGTYLVMRQLRQDVRKFWQFVYERSGGNAAEADKLGAAFVGRTRAGDPLVPTQSAPIPGIDPKTRRKINSPSRKTRMARVVRSVRTFFARIRATPISKAGRPD